MSKWYNVAIVVYKNLLVEVEDDKGEQEAYEAAYSECSYDSAEIEEVDIKNLESAKRHADEVIDL